jgi:hypothetical protein
MEVEFKNTCNQHAIPIRDGTTAHQVEKYLFERDPFLAGQSRIYRDSKAEEQEKEREGNTSI